MNDNSNNDFTSNELKLIDNTFTERYNKAIETQRADIKLRVDKAKY